MMNSTRSYPPRRSASISRCVFVLSGVRTNDGGVPVVGPVSDGGCGIDMEPHPDQKARCTGEGLSSNTI